MKELIKRVAAATGVDEGTAKTAIGCVLLFLRDEAPESQLNELIYETPTAHEAVAAAGAISDGGVTAAIGALGSLVGQGRMDINTLYGKLHNLGLDEDRSTIVLSEVLAHAETLVGKEGLEKLMRDIPSLCQRAGLSPSGEALRRSP
jgi:hypothetical protein